MEILNSHHFAAICIPLIDLPLDAETLEIMAAVKVKDILIHVIGLSVVSDPTIMDKLKDASKVGLIANDTKRLMYSSTDEED